MISVKEEQSLLQLLGCILRDEAWPAGALPPSRELLRRHHLRPLAHSAGVEGLGDDLRECAALAAFHRRSLEELGALFEESTLPWLPIKGADYAWSLYPDPSLRPMSDLDLLVEASRFGEAMELLRSAGFQERPSSVSTRHAQTFVRRAHEIVDLHRSMFQPMRSNAGLESMWARAEQQTGEAHRGSVRFRPSDRFLLHLSHMARHEFVVPLVSYVDAHQLLATLDADDEVEMRAQLDDFHLLRPLALLLELLDELSSGGVTARRTASLLTLPTLRELVQGAHRNRQTQLRRKLLLFPRDALPLALGWGRRRVEDALMARRAGR